MAVPAGPTEKRYTGNGVTTIFTIPFLLLAASDLDVFLDGVEIVSGFTIAGEGNPASTITFTTAPPNLSSILLNLNVPFERLNDYQENGDLLSSTVNRDFDRIWQALKQLFRYSTRSLTLGFFDVDGAGAYRAKGNRIADLADPIGQQDAATKNWVGLLLDGVSGVVNTTVGIAYDAGTLFDYLRFGVSRSVDSITALKALSPSRNQRATVENDKFVSRYRFDSTSVATPDDATVVLPNSGSGRWLINHDGSMSLYQWGVVGDKVTDDTARVQAATNWASTGAYELVVPSWLGARLTAPILVSGSPRLSGEHIQISKTAGLNVNDPGIGAWFYIAHAGIGFKFNDLGLIVQRTSLEKIGTYRDQPVPGSGAYTPSANDYDFYFYNCDSVIRDIVTWNPTKAIYITANSGTSQSRADISGVYGCPYQRGIVIDFLADVARIDNIHWWPYTSNNVNVAAYIRTNCFGVATYRCDNPMITRYFTYGLRHSIYVGTNASGTTSKIKCSMFDFDAIGQSAVFVDGAGSSGSLSQGVGQGQSQTATDNFFEFSASTSGCNFALNNIDVGLFGKNALRCGGTANNLLRVGSNVRIYQWNGANLGYPAIDCTPGNIVELSTMPYFTAPLNSGVALANSGSIKGRAEIDFITYSTDAAGKFATNAGFGRTPTAIYACVQNDSTAIHVQQSSTANVMIAYTVTTGAVLASSTVRASLQVVFK